MYGVAVFPPGIPTDGKPGTGRHEKESVPALVLVDWDAFKATWLELVWKVFVAEVAPGPAITIVIGFAGGGGGAVGQVLTSSLGAPAGGRLVVLSMQGMALRYA